MPGEGQPLSCPHCPCLYLENTFLKVWVAEHNLSPPPGNLFTDLKLFLKMEDWPGKGDMLGFAGCHVHPPSYSTQVRAPRALLNSGTFQYPGLASCHHAMASDPLSVTLTCVPCSGESIVTLVLSVYVSPFYHVGSQVACSLCLSHLHPQPGLEATTRDDFTELLNANQLLLMLQVLQLLPVLCLLCTFRHPGHHPILKMSESQDRRHQQSERDWGGR